MPTQPTIVELDREQIAELLRRAEESLDAEDYATIKALVESYAYLADLVGDKNITLGRLRKMLFGASTEKTASVVGGQTPSPAAAPGEPSPATSDSEVEANAGNGSSTSEEGRADGHGRHGVDDYPGAATIEVRHESLQPGDRCPECEAGTLYDTGRPGVLVRLAGQAPVGATILRLQKLRCGLCGVLFSPQDRLLLHQTESGPVMENLHAWLSQQMDQRRVEPNSGLGKAISYLLRHWKPLTLFLRVAGAPLDNNVCEQALKKAILHRKNALFYKTRHGAHVGDLFMSLIHTCELGGINPFDYLTELDRHATEASARPQTWLPWNYRETLSRPASPAT